MAYHRCYRGRVYASLDLQRDEEMSEGMHPVEGEAAPFALSFEPRVRCRRMHRHTVPLCEQAVVILPFVAEIIPVGVLVGLVGSEQVDDRRRQVNQSGGFIRLGYIRIDALIRGVVGCVIDHYGAALKVDVLPLDAEQLAAAAAGVDRQREEYLVFHRCLR